MTSISLLGSRSRFGKGARVQRLESLVLGHGPFEELLPVADDPEGMRHTGLADLLVVAEVAFRCDFLPTHGQVDGCRFPFKQKVSLLVHVENHIGVPADAVLIVTSTTRQLHISQHDLRRQHRRRVDAAPIYSLAPRVAAGL